MTPPDPKILANLQRLRDGGAPDSVLEQYLAEAHSAPTPAQRQLHARDVARRMTSANEADQAQLPTYGTQVAGGIASLARDIPGAEAVQAGARSLVRGQPYQTALQDIRGAEDDSPVSGANRLIGGTIGALATPGSPMLSGARFGIASGLLGADPATVETRLHDAAAKGVLGAAAGKIGEVVGTAGRALAPVSAAA